MQNTVRAFLFMIGLTFTIQASANEASQKLVQFWLTTRYQDCDESFRDVVLKRNPGTIIKIMATKCLSVNYEDRTSQKTIDCFSQIDKDFAPSFTTAEASNMGCREKSDYAEFKKGGVKIVPETIYSADIVCRENDNSKFKYYKIDASHTSCSKKYSCKNSFKFGSEQKVPKGDYVFRCTPKATEVAAYNEGKTTSPCESVNIVNCVQESYSSINFIGSASEPKYVKPAGAAAR